VSREKHAIGLKKAQSKKSAFQKERGRKKARLAARRGPQITQITQINADFSGDSVLFNLWKSA
jgi:hypothetical protein